MAEEPVGCLGPYRLLARLPGGHGSEVHLGLDGDGRRVVVKHHGRGPADERGLAEAALLGLVHPGLLACRDAFRVHGDGALVTVTDRLTGVPLSPGSLSALTPADLVSVAVRLLSALGALHGLGLVHRDLKPDNLFLEGPAPQPVLLDFGLACPLDECGARPLAGTPRTMAPELFAGRPASVPSDLWAAGLVLAEGRLGRPLVGTGPAADMARERAALRVPEAALAAAGCPPDLLRLLVRLLDPDPARRPASAELALAGLDPGADRARRQLAQVDLAGRASAAFARADERRRGRLEALRDGLTFVDLFPGGASEPSQAFGILAAYAGGPDRRDGVLAARLGSEARTPADLLAVVDALLRHGPLVLGVHVAEGSDEPGRLRRRELREALMARAKESAPPGALRIVDAAPPTVAQCEGTLAAWLGDALGGPAVLAARVRRQPPSNWRAWEAALAELARTKAVSAGPLGVILDETAIPPAWPDGDLGAAPRLADGPAEVLALLSHMPRALGGPDVSALLDRDSGADLAALQVEGLVVERRGVDGPLLAPADERLRSVCSQGSLRARVAARAALALAAPGAAPDEPVAAQVAALVGAGPADGPDPAALTEWLLACAATLRRAGRLTLADQLLGRALAGTPPDAPQRRALHRERIDVLLRQGTPEQITAALADGAAESPRDAAILFRRGRFLAQRGRLAEALALLAPLDGAGLAEADAILLLQVRGGVLHGLGRNAEALTDLREALRRQGSAPHTRTMTLLERLGFVERELGQHERAIRSFEAAMAMAKDLGHDALVWSPLYNIGRTIRDRGDKRRGLQIQEQAAAICERTGNRAGLATVLNSLGAGWLTLGRTDLSRRHLQRALELARDLGNAATEAMVHNNLGTALAAESRLPEAEASFAASLALREKLGDARGRAAVRLTRGPVRLVHGDLRGAEADLAQARVDLQGLSAPNWEVALALLEARLHLAGGRRDAARSSAAAARALATAHGFQPERLRSRALLCRAGADDLADLEAAAADEGPWTAEALLARAALGAAGGRDEPALADLDRAAAVLASTPDDLLELELLEQRLALQLGALERSLAGAEPDPARVGALLSGVSRDLDRADVLVSVHALPGARETFATFAARLSAMDRQDAVTGLTSLAGRLRDLERLAEITKRLSAERDTQKLLDLIIDSALELTGAARGFLILFDGKAEDFRAARNIDAGTIADPEFQVSHSVARKVVREGRPLLTANAVDDERLTSAASISELRLLSILCVPIAWRGRIQGAVYLDHPRVVGRFRESHLETVTRLAEQAAIALENSRLQSGLAESNAELETRRAEVTRLNEALQDRLLRREAELLEARESLDASRRALALRYDYSSIVTRSPRMHAVLDLLDRVTDTHFPVVIHGESGTGKELLARAIHFNGPRREQNFLSINCAAIAEPLIESELFGSVRGAFTGADRDRKGLFAQAHGGTLFLDEIGDMSLDVQKRLLRVLQDGEFLPVGGREVVKVDVRILCATHRSLEQRVSEGRFREDLFYRLAVARVELPPLRERPEDLAVLLPHFLERHGGRPRTVEPEALALLEARPWPGNVRELENFAMNLLLFDRDGERLTGDLVRRLLAGSAGGAALAAVVPAATGPVGAGPLKDRLVEFERAAVQEALATAQGNKAAAARSLGVPVRTLYKILDRLGL